MGNDAESAAVRLRADRVSRSDSTMNPEEYLKYGAKMPLDKMFLGWHGASATRAEVIEVVRIASEMTLDAYEASLGARVLNSFNRLLSSEKVSDIDRQFFIGSMRAMDLDINARIDQMNEIIIEHQKEQERRRAETTQSGGLEVKELQNNEQ